MDLPKASDENANIVTTVLADGNLLVEVTGSLNMRDPSSMLRTFFEALHRTIRAEKRKTVRIDLRNLKYMNSVGFKYIAAWLTAHAESPQEERYNIIFIISPKHHWQTVSMHALQAFSKGYVAVEIDRFAP